MYQRIVCFKFKPTASQDAIANHMASFAALKDAIPQIASYSGGHIVAADAPTEAYDSMHYLTFACLEDIEIYRVHPAHQAFITQNQDAWTDVLVLNAVLA